jgi:peptide methionine sulfoxide reductase msrA/msrB
MRNKAKIIGRVLVLGLLAVAVVVGLRPPRVMSTSNTTEKTVTYNKLTPDEERVILQKGTEMPFSGKYYQYDANGTYTCKRCGASLYRSTDKFDAGCGWPSFDDAIPGAVKRTTDADGMRTEITCANCGAHLGHVFEGERFTPKDVRYCVNSISLNFIPVGDSEKSNSSKALQGSEKVSLEKAYFAGGCFWGTEYYLEKADGVSSVTVGYMGGHTDNPTYKQVCSGTTGHAEAAEVVFDPAKTNYEKLTRLFFEIHDPTQMNRQGPDIGEQYRSAIFYVNDTQKQIATKLIDILKSKGYDVVTELSKAGTFWPAEDYHQGYYDHTGKQPYCHFYQKRF